MDPGDWFQDGFTVASQSSSSADGSPVFSAQRSIKGFQTQQNRRVPGPQGIVIVTVSVFMTDAPILPSDRIWPPGANTAKVAESRRVGAVNVQHQKDSECTLYLADLQ